MLAITTYSQRKINTLVSFVETENIASRRVLEKSGFHHIGISECHYGMLERYEINRPRSHLQDLPQKDL